MEGARTLMPDVSLEQFAQIVQRAANAYPRDLRRELDGAGTRMASGLADTSASIRRPRRSL